MGHWQNKKGQKTSVEGKYWLSETYSQGASKFIMFSKENEYRVVSPSGNVFMVNKMEVAPDIARNLLNTRLFEFWNLNLFGQTAESWGLSFYEKAVEQPQPPHPIEKKPQRPPPDGKKQLTQVKIYINRKITNFNLIDISRRVQNVKRIQPYVQNIGMELTDGGTTLNLNFFHNPAWVIPVLIAVIVVGLTIIAVRITKIYIQDKGIEQEQARNQTKVIDECLSSYRNGDITRDEYLKCLNSVKDIYPAGETSTGETVATAISGAAIAVAGIVLLSKKKR